MHWIIVWSKVSGILNWKKRSAELIKKYNRFPGNSRFTGDRSFGWKQAVYRGTLPGRDQLEQIAALYHFNASYFSTLFKQRFGISFSEYLSDIRMEKAENLLKTSSDKVRKIALEVGYKDPNYFNRAFKKRHNMTPEEFRKRVGWWWKN